MRHITLLAQFNVAIFGQHTLSHPSFGQCHYFMLVIIIHVLNLQTCLIEVTNNFNVF